MLFQLKGLPFFVSASNDKTVRLWNAGEKKALQTVAHDNAVNALSWRSDGAVLATGAGRLVRLYETK